jgi:hypothetical protein
MINPQECLFDSSSAVVRGLAAQTPPRHLDDYAIDCIEKRF